MAAVAAAARSCGGRFPRRGQRAPGREVPKTMSHARCAGCSRGQFRGADGVGLQPCRGCGKVYYCGAACAKFDEQSHRQICKFYSNGVWTPAGKRPEDDYWVNNAAMAKARRSLRARMQQGDFTEDEAIEEMERLDALQEAEVAKDRAARERQRHIEWLAYNGMDGPRPCMYNNGKRRMKTLRHA